MDNYSNTFTDTRGMTGKGYSFCEVVLEGIAPGGGLFVPEQIPRYTCDEICALAALPYAKRAADIYKRFGVDLPDETIDTLMANSYGSNFDDEAIAPIIEVAPGMHVLELWHGPTSAFKDMALQCLPQFFSASIAQLRERGRKLDDYLILVATSGDTGKAALEGFADREHVGIVVFYPDGGVSDVQFKQMATQRGGNVCVFGARGNFDDCQTSVKQAMGDEAFKQMLHEERGLKLSSANSINWGRLLPQIVYYVSSYGQMVQSGAVEAGKAIDICVPTGNFGNILAAYYAKRMGTPISMLLCASNENRVLSDFINTGTYSIAKREFYLTPSPSMDILVSSNLERQLFELTGRNAASIRKWMEELNTEKGFSVDPNTFIELRENFRADFADAEDCFETIKQVYEKHHYLLDPHSAVAWTVAERLRANKPVLIASTAHWAKFGASVYRALNGISPKESLPEEIEALGGIKLNSLIEQSYNASPVPQGLAELDELPLRFTEVVEGNKDGVESAALSFLNQ